MESDHLLILIVVICVLCVGIGLYIFLSNPINKILPTTTTTIPTTTTTTTTLNKILNFQRGVNTLENIFISNDVINEVFGGKWKPVGRLTFIGTGFSEYEANNEGVLVEYGGELESDIWPSQNEIRLQVFQFNSSEKAVDFVERFVGLKPEIIYNFHNASNYLRFWTGECDNDSKITIDKNNISDTSYIIFGECNVECINTQPDSTSLQHVYIISAKYNFVTFLFYNAPVKCDSLLKGAQERASMNAETIPKLPILVEKQQQHIEKLWDDLHLIDN